MGVQKIHRLIKVYLVPGETKKDVLKAAWSGQDLEMFLHDQFVASGEKKQSWWETLRKQVFGK